MAVHAKVRSGPYFRGTTVRIQVTFTNAAGTPTNPTAITFKYETPAGVEASDVSPTNITVVGSGVYYRDLVLNEVSNGENHWQWEFVGTGAVAAVYAGEIVVLASAFA